MRHLLVAMVIWSVPIASFGATNTIGAEVGRGHAADIDCAPDDGSGCNRQDDSWRLYYEFRLDSGLGLRITHTELNDLRITTDLDETFNAPGISAAMDDLAVTYSYAVSKLVSIAGKVGIARWQESRSRGGFLDQDTSDGLSPALGFNVDFGNRLLRVGLSADIYPSLGNTGYVSYLGAGVRFVW